MRFHRAKMNRTRILLFVLSVALFDYWGFVSGEEIGKYTPDWDSLDSRPLPAWYDEAKVGIFMHFGPYAVPGLESEWFWLQSIRNESDGDRRCAAYMKDYFPPKFTYQDFGPMLTMEFFDAEKFADLVADAGAKYIVFTSKHHDGFCNWPSTYTYGWNSMAIGPRRNVLKELKDAFDKNHPELHFGLYYSLFEWFNPIYLQDKESGFVEQEYSKNKMQPEMEELIREFTPDVLWVDGDWEAQPEYFESQKFLAWLYNESPSKDTVVTNDRWGIGTAQQHGGFYSGPDRFSPGTLQAHKWENAMTIDEESWGIRRNINIEDVLTMDDIVGLIASTVSCGGNILINVGPTKEGTIIPVFQERLKSIGNWLKVNGDSAIYSSEPWTFQNDSSNGKVWYTKKGDNVYGISLGWPDNDILRVSSPEVREGTTRIQMIGYQGHDLEYTVENSVVSIQFPSLSALLRSCPVPGGCQWGYVLEFQGLDNKEVDKDRPKKYWLQHGNSDKELATIQVQEGK